MIHSMISPAPNVCSVYTDMATCASFEVQMSSIMEVLTKTALAEITKLVDDASVELRLAMCRSQSENEALKSKLLVMEGELLAAQGCGDGTPGSSLNIAFEVKVCDEFREAQNSKVGGEGSIIAVERVFDERLSTGPAKDEQYVGLPVEKKEDALEIKYEPVDGEQDWSESVLFSEDWLEEDPKMSQSQLEQKISEEDSYGTSGAAAANCGKGPLCEEEELHMQPCPAGDQEKGLLAKLKQEPDGDPLTPGHPLPGSTEGLEVQCAWSKATRSGKVWEMLRHHGGGSEHGGVWSTEMRDETTDSLLAISELLLRSEKNEGPTSHLKQKQNGHPRGPPDGISTEMVFPLGSRGERIGTVPCEERFDASAEAEIRQRIEGREEFVCTCCGKMFPDTLELQTHEEQHDKGKRFNCSECGKAFACFSDLEKHQRIYCPKAPFTCSGYDKTFSQRHVLQAHKSMHSGEKPHVCTDCGKHFSQKSYLKTHQHIHASEKPFVCAQCGKSFSQISNLKSHQITHTGEKPFVCVQCGKSFSQISGLKTHQITHTGEKRFCCTVCNKSFAYLHVLKRHQRVHTGEKWLLCKLCGKLFDGADSLKQHHLTHHGGKRFSFTLCGKSFTSKSSLKTHESVHTGEKPHSCNECGKSFAHLRNLRTHRGVHTGQKPHSCNECGKSFAHLRNLKTHQSVHTGEKPHRCDECGKSFAQLGNLKTHQRVHTGEKPYGCTLCSKSFSQNRGLRKHILTHS